MVQNRKSTSTIAKSRKSRNSNITSFDSPAASRKRLGETLSVKTKRIRVEYEEIFNRFKEAHDAEVSSTVLSMGTGDAGQLGLGDRFLERKRPFPIDDLTDIIKICAGGMHNVCLSKTGKVSSFGCNDDFALGRILADDEESMIPGEVKIPTKSDIIDITAGDNHSAVLTADGKVFIWGTFRDNASIIGLMKPSERVAEPVEVHTSKQIVKIASGENHFVMLTDMGELLTFGCAEQGQLGRVREVYFMRGGKSGLEMILTPAPVRVKQNVRFNDVWAGSYCTIAKSIDGDLYGCGLNNYTQLGVSHNDTNDLSTVWMTKLDKFNNLGHSWKKFAFGLHHTLALNDSGTVFSIGRGDYGNLGLGNREHQDEVRGLSNLIGKFVNISACGHVSYALKEDGTAWSWGCGNTYQLGHGDDEDSIEPGMVEGKFLKDMTVMEVSVGGQHVLFRTIKKEIKCEDILSLEIDNSVIENKSEYNSPALDVSNTAHIFNKDKIEITVNGSIEVEACNIEHVSIEDHKEIINSDVMNVKSQNGVQDEIKVSEITVESMEMDSVEH